MSGYGFKKPNAASADEVADKLNLSGLSKAPLRIDRVREEEAIARGAAMGFVDRAQGEGENVSARPSRRRRETVAQGNLFIKGPQETLDWFVEFTNQRGHRSYWQALEELRALTAKG
ncbi:MAG: hypothetical protein ABWY12_00060 [Burkholderiales bacterium]